jgi:hypothetical protein
LYICYCTYVIVHMLLYICYCTYVIVHMLLYICYCTYVIVRMLLYICYCTYVIVHMFLYICYCTYVIVLMLLYVCYIIRDHSAFWHFIRYEPYKTMLNDPNDDIAIKQQHIFLPRLTCKKENILFLK